MKRKDDIELRRSVRLLCVARRDARLADRSLTARNRAWRALQVALEADGLSDSARAYLTAAKDNLATLGMAAYAAERAYDKEMDSLAFLLGIR